MEQYKNKSIESPTLRYISREISDVKVVLDIGSCWGCDSLILKELFPDAKIYAFECTPHSINI